MVLNESVGLEWNGVTRYDGYMVTARGVCVGGGHGQITNVCCIVCHYFFFALSLLFGGSSHTVLLLLLDDFLIVHHGARPHVGLHGACHHYL